MHIHSAQEPTLKADPRAQRQLLEVQELDSRIDQLRHRRAALPEHVELENLAAQRKHLDDRARDARIKVDDLTVAQRKADADVESVRARRRRDQERIDAGLISNPKDLERMQKEIENIDRRIGVLEDEELEVMEQLEESQGTLDELTAQLAELDGRIAEVTAARDEAAGRIDSEGRVAVAQRPSTVEGTPADLLALYEKLRSQKGGVGVGLLRARQCGGCGLSLDQAELSRIRSAPTDEVIRCEECSRILVRTDESGL
ncbi:zinc ribbon domain-containing protein [Nocardioides insulae]|uniref:zinc ribbon domain-containing protein n=1 Tax=Nocardioides insulae TaxID=394734 RepID=UPI00040735A8|nr:C4-type zinc ribbon domain-containing protein [Nocardioides insulae]